MPSANLRRIAHQCSNFIQTFTFHGQLAAEGVAVVQTPPWSVGLQRVWPADRRQVLYLQRRDGRPQSQYARESPAHLSTLNCSANKKGRP